MRNTFKAYERLKREQHIDTLFQTGKAFSVFPIKAVHISITRAGEPSPVRVGFSVPKKRFSSSVDRHRIRRLMVEAWRLNKQTLYNSVETDKQVQLFLIFTGDTLPEYTVVEQAVIKVAEKLGELYNA
ncbi:MAG TPA: ribonuclease P protein component [Flavipsychrobacter sp.]|nr:ribonuclease P protein component [Flavipsychrobacter sp.]